MPNYHYRCQTCGAELEVKQSFNDDPLTDCPEGCQEGSLRKVFSRVGISFKGSGFYKNDHGTSAARTKPEDRGESPKDSKKSSGESDGNGAKPSSGGNDVNKTSTQNAQPASSTNETTSG